MISEKLKVMISSTISDLLEERKSAEDAIQNFEFERFRSEALPSIAESPRQLCKEMAEECDIYILIVGNRYGWLVPDLNVSVTEFEFDVAYRSDPSKILIFVQNDPDGQREVSQKEFLNKVADFDSGFLFAKPFSSPKELDTQVKSALSNWITGKVHNKGLSLRNVTALSGLHSTWRSMIALVIIVFLITGLMVIARELVISQFDPKMLPSLSDLWDVWATEFPTLANSFNRTWRATSVAFISGCLVSAALVVPLLLGRNKRPFLSAFVPLLFYALSVIAIFFSPYFLRGEMSRLIPLVSIVSAWTSTIICRERDAIPGRLTLLSARQSLLPNVCMSQSVPQGFVVAAAISFVVELFLPSYYYGIGNLFLNSLNSFQIPLSYTILSTFVLLLGITYFLLRGLQAHFAMLYIVLPRLRGYTAE